jgi:hypothetical protein
MVPIGDTMITIVTTLLIKIMTTRAIIVGTGSFTEIVIKELIAAISKSQTDRIV